MLDKLDRDLILQLQKDGRQNNTKLASELGVSERTVRNRLSNLLEKNVIKITTIPNLENLGFNFVAIVGLQIQLASLDKIRETLTRQPNICYFANVTGRYDLILIAVTRSSREFAGFMEKTISVIPGILRTETFVNLHLYKGEVTGLDTRHLIDGIIG
jgi:Lrp/AsnC family transcriptional regulator, regulator for asnA, asnC and gidA